MPRQRALSFSYPHHALSTTHPSLTISIPHHLHPSPPPSLTTSIPHHLHPSCLHPSPSSLTTSSPYHTLSSPAPSLTSSIPHHCTAFLHHRFSSLLTTPTPTPLHRPYFTTSSLLHHIVFPLSPLASSSPYLGPALETHCASHCRSFRRVWLLVPPPSALAVSAGGKCPIGGVGLY